MRQIIKKEGSIYCNGGVWSKLQDLIININPSKIFVLTDENTANYCLTHLLNNIHFKTPPEVLIVPAGEQNKTIKTCLNLWEDLSEKGADRGSLLLNLGGGMVTDMGGFVASTFKRGITFINIPTSLLAMVDASIGGKNGVDLGVLKNQIGVINNAQAVIIDTAFLKTLPYNEVISGFAEMLKHGLIYSKNYWDSLQNFNVENKENTEEGIWKSIEIKHEIVTIDPTEKKERKALNFGHTLGHAIESFCLGSNEKTTLLHGEAIAIGMILTCFISTKLLGFAEIERDKVTQIIITYFPIVHFSEEDIDVIIKLLKYDKKNKNGTVMFVLLSNYGETKTDKIVSNELIKEAFTYYQSF